LLKIEFKILLKKKYWLKNRTFEKLSSKIFSNKLKTHTKRQIHLDLVIMNNMGNEIICGFEFLKIMWIKN
jgi:hypothetical protein